MEHVTVHVHFLTRIAIDFCENHRMNFESKSLYKNNLGLQVEPTICIFLSLIEKIILSFGNIYEARTNR